MPLKFRCTSCTARLHVPSRWAGTTIECPKCATRVVVPASEDGQPGNPFESRRIEKRIDSIEPPSFELPEELLLAGAGRAVPERTSRRGRRPAAISLTIPLLAAAGGLALLSGGIGFLLGLWWRAK